MKLQSFDAHELFKMAWSATGDDEQMVGLNQSAGLSARVVGAWSAWIQPAIRHPMRQCTTMLADTLIRQRQIIVSVGVSGNDANRRFVGIDRFVQTLQLDKCIS